MKASDVLFILISVPFVILPLLLLAVSKTPAIQTRLLVVLLLALLAVTWMLNVCTTRVKSTLGADRRRKSATDTAEWLRNKIKESGFVSIQQVEGLLTPALVRSILPNPNNAELVSAIVHKAPKLFAVLLLINEHSCIHQILDHGADDDILISFKPQGPMRTPKGLLLDFSKIGPKGLQKDIYDSHAKFPFPITSEGTPEYAQSQVVPYRPIKHISSGGGGSVFIAEVAGGHLKGCPSVGVL